jgi:hypothetical protein
MRIFLSASYEDAKNDGDYLRQFGSICRGSNVEAVKFKTDTPSMYAEIVQWCKMYQADAMVITNQVTLEFVLKNQVDFRQPDTRKGITLNDYQGSYLDVRIDDNRTIPAVVLNPLEHFRTVPYGKFLAEKFLSKILAPEKWLPDIPFKWKVVDDYESGRAVADRLARARLIGVDIETPTIGEWSEARGINCVGYAGFFADTGTIECFVFPFSEWAYSLIQSINDNPVPKVTQRGIYDNAYFLRWGIPLRAWYWDTYNFFHSWLAELPKNLALVSAFNVRKIRYWKDDGKSGGLEDYYRYNAQDCWGTVCSLLGILHSCPDWAVTNYVEHEFPVVFPAIHCEMEGWKVDTERFHQVFAEKMQEKEEELIEIQTMLGGPCDPLPIKKDKHGKHKIQYFNPNSPAQVLTVFKCFKLDHLGSTDKAAVLKARAAHPLADRVIGAIADWKSNAKIISNYLQEYKLWNGRLYYSLDPGGTDTGRLACKASNYWCGFQIQNVPRDDSIKQCLIADDGWLLGEGDYAQSEARCVGYLSGETRLINLVEGPHDYHSWNASAFFGVPYECIYDDSLHKTLDKALRDLSKRTNHGANYNMGEGVMLDTMGPKRVAEAKRLLKLPVVMPLKKVCRFLLDRYNETYPKVKGDFYTHVVTTIRASGLHISALGWTRKFFGKPWDNKPDLNSAVAHPPQNLSVGIINKCFYRLWHDQVYGDLRGIFRIKAQIHDSIPYQYRADHPEVPGIVQERMRFPVNIADCDGVVRTMLIPPDMAAGKKRWSELK